MFEISTHNLCTQYSAVIHHCGYEHTVRVGISNNGTCNMLQGHEFGLLNAMKDCLRDLENTTLISPDDLDIIDEKRILRQKIAELERDSDGQMAA